MNLGQFLEYPSQNLPTEDAPQRADGLAALLFDWGNTLMKVFPEYQGPMADWPCVEAMPRTAETLAELSRRYAIVLVSNSADSNAKKIRGALKRAGLDPWITAIFTANDVGYRKPDPAYIRFVLDKLGLRPGQAAIIGDSLADDVQSGLNAGVPAIWLNNTPDPCPGAWPEQDGEISGLDEIPALLERMRRTNVSVQCCRAWVEGEGVNAGLLGHVSRVAQTAYSLAVWLQKTGEAVDPVLAHRGGLLHDLDKLTSRQTGEAHGERSAKLLFAWGQPELAEIARRHLLSTDGGNPQKPRTWEEKLVFYADKIVEGDQIESFSHRLAALKARYPDYARKMEEGIPFMLGLEADICRRLAVTPDELQKKLREIIQPGAVENKH